MNAFVQATRRLRADYAPGVWVGAIRQVFGEGEIVQAERIERYPPHYLVAVWQPLAVGAPVLPRWPEVAAIASPDSQAALVLLMRHVPGEGRLWLAHETIDWVLVADIVRLTDRNLAPYHHVELERFIADRRREDEAHIRTSYTDRDEGYEAMKRQLFEPKEPG